MHRFYQMWQQLDCNVDERHWNNPSGCDAGLFPWVEATVGAGTNGITQPANFSTEYSPSAVDHWRGLYRYGLLQRPERRRALLQELADNYAMSDNFHQSVNGGTGANHIMFGHADAIWFSDGNGNPAVPPTSHEVGRDPMPVS